MRTDSRCAHSQHKRKPSATGTPPRASAASAALLPAASAAGAGMLLAGQELSRWHPLACHRQRCPPHPHSTAAPAAPPAAPAALAPPAPPLLVRLKLLVLLLLAPPASPPASPSASPSDKFHGSCKDKSDRVVGVAVRCVHTKIGHSITTTLRRPHSHDVNDLPCIRKPQPEVIRAITMEDIPCHCMDCDAHRP